MLTQRMVLDFTDRYDCTHKVTLLFQDIRVTIIISGIDKRKQNTPWGLQN